MVGMPEKRVVREEEIIGKQLFFVTEKKILNISSRGVAYIAVAAGFFGGVFAGSIATRSILQRRHRRELRKKNEDGRSLLQNYLTRENVWEEEYLKLHDRYQLLLKDVEERDYEEFKAPDANQDDLITREEFNNYVTKYLATFPELAEKDFPKFDDFDTDHDGLVSFKEWKSFINKQKLRESQTVAKKNEGSGERALKNNPSGKLYYRTG